ncbi:hypothetical protein VTN77DRAFT_9056 [Rasamsonia byssochlamydoides]|uniref:uncharacterized protein n=1 Tax=Rasamsonia byssochlamydoides TaxID=89139 RepID=UPI0037444D51
MTAKASSTTTTTNTTTTTFTATRWITLAIASGTFAAMNGLFAKLTTAGSTASVAHRIAQFLHLPDDGLVEVVVRGICFALNLLSNVIMWALFTRALTAAPSTTKVSITNTSANFLVTAILGMIVFGERVRGLWWVGAAMMAAGCILVGMREKMDDSSDNRSNNSSGNGSGNKKNKNSDVQGRTRNANNEGVYHDENEEEEDGDAAEDDALLAGGQQNPAKSGSK